MGCLSNVCWEWRLISNLFNFRSMKVGIKGDKFQFFQNVFLYFGSYDYNSNLKTFLTEGTGFGFMSCIYVFQKVTVLGY